MADPEVKADLTATGGLRVTHDFGEDAVTKTRIQRVWDVPNPIQAEKHLPQFTGVSAGDASAVRDAANEAKKQQAS